MKWQGSKENEIAAPYYPLHANSEEDVDSNDLLVLKVGAYELVA